MKEVTLGPGDTIFSQGDIDNRLFYVFKGQVDYCLEYDHKVIKFGSYKVNNSRVSLLLKGNKWY